MLSEVFFKFILLKNMHLQYRSLNGAYSYPFADYYSVGLDLVYDTAEFLELSRIIDPYCK